MQTGTGEYTRFLRDAYDDLTRAYDPLDSNRERLILKYRNLERCLWYAAAAATLGWCMAAWGWLR